MKFRFYSDLTTCKLVSIYWHSVINDVVKNPNHVMKQALLHNILFLFTLISRQGGHAVVQFVEALRYKPENSRAWSPMGSLDLSLTYPSGCMALGSTQPLTEKSTHNISWGAKVASAYVWRLCHLHVPNVYKFCGPQTPEALRAYLLKETNSSLFCEVM